MPRQQAGILRQGEYLGANAFHQLACVSAGEVRPSDAVLENQITTEADSCFCTVKNHVAGSMPGSMANFKGCLPQPKDLSVLEIDARLRSGVDLESEHWRTSFRPPQCMVAGMQGYQWK